MNLLELGPVQGSDMTYSKVSIFQAGRLKFRAWSFYLIDLGLKPRVSV